jgi:hypothetical protein
MTLESIQRCILIIGLTAMVAGCVGAPGPSRAMPEPSGQVPSLASLPEGFPVGSWTSTITEQDLRQAGMTEDGLIKENAGVFITTFGPDGTWSTSQATDAPIRWPLFRGTFTVAGDGLIDQTTTFPPEYAGDVVRFTWRMEDGALVLGVPQPPDPVLKILTETHPWQPVD